MRTNIMISSRLNRREFCYASLLAVLPTATRKTSRLRLPAPEFQIGDRIRTERICNDQRSSNYGGIDWESGFIVGHVWQFDEWQSEEFHRGWTYWVLFDKSNSEINGDRHWLDFIHHTEVIRE